MGYAPIPGTTWSINVSALEKEIMANVYKLRNVFLIASAILIVLGAVVMVFVGRGLTRPLKDVASLTHELAKGDLSVEVPQKHLQREDEFGYLAKSYDTLIINFRQLIGGISGLAKEVARSSDSLTEISQNSASTMEEISASTEEIAATMEQVSASAQEINASSEEMRSSVDSLNLVIKELRK